MKSKRRLKLKKRDAPVERERPNTVVGIIFQGIPIYERNEFRAWCQLQGYTMTGVIRGFIKACAEGKINLVELDIDARSLATKRKRRKW